MVDGSLIDLERVLFCSLEVKGKFFKVYLFLNRLWIGEERKNLEDYFLIFLEEKVDLFFWLFILK